MSILKYPNGWKKLKQNAHFEQILKQKLASHGLEQGYNSYTNTSKHSKM